jgi:hypothetical protein
MGSANRDGMVSEQEFIDAHKILSQYWSIESSYEMVGPVAEEGQLELQGVSVSHLRDGFIDAVLDAGLNRQSKVYEIEPLVIRHKASANQICPRDGQLGAAYVDCVPTGDCGHATFMLS